MKTMHENRADLKGAVGKQGAAGKTVGGRTALRCLRNLQRRDVFRLTDGVPVFWSSRQMMIPKDSRSSLRGGRQAEEAVFGRADRPVVHDADARTPVPDACRKTGRERRDARSGPNFG